MAAATPRTLVLLLALWLLASPGSAIRLPGFQRDCSNKAHKARAGSVVLGDSGFAFSAAAEGARSEAAAAASCLQAPLPLRQQSVRRPGRLAEAVAMGSRSGRPALPCCSIGAVFCLCRQHRRLQPAPPPTQPLCVPRRPPPPALIPPTCRRRGLGQLPGRSTHPVKLRPTARRHQRRLRRRRPALCCRLPGRLPHSGENLR
jgi:hypothetical protein